MRRGLLLLGLSMVPGACADRAEPPRASADLSILTVNLLTFAVDANVQPRTEAVIALIREKQPDFIALQEAAESSQVRNRAEVIAAATGYQYVWTATELDEGADYHGGPALLSRWPIRSQEIFDLPHLDFGGEVQRRAIRVTARTALGDVAVVATHISTAPDPQIKADQSVAGAQLLLDSRSTLPGFYAGDFNAEPDSLAMRALRGESDYGGLMDVFVDAWLQAGSGEPGFTYPARAPATRIDYIYSVAGTEKIARAVACQTLLETPRDGIYASDHLALLCAFAIE